MFFVAMVVIGLAVGGAVKLLVPGSTWGDLVTTLLLGVCGSLLAGAIGRGLEWYEGTFEWRSLAGSALGAMMVLFVYRLSVGLRRSLP